MSAASSQGGGIAGACVRATSTLVDTCGGRGKAVAETHVGLMYAMVLKKSINAGEMRRIRGRVPDLCTVRDPLD